MRKLIFLIGIISLPSVIWGQEISENLESYQVTTAGDRIVLTGFKPLSKMQNFIAVLYDKNLSVINRYEKKIDEGVKTYYVGKSGDLFIFTFYNASNKEKFHIALDANFLEKSAAAPDPKTAQKNDDDNNVYGVEWTYEPGFCNYYVYGDLMLEAEADVITCYSLADPIHGDYKKKWEKTYTENRFVKMNLVSIEDRTAYYFAAGVGISNVQKLIAVDIDNGTILFSNDLNTADSLDAICISNIYIKDQVIYAAGTYVLTEENQVFPVSCLRDDAYQARGFSTRDDFFMAGADGYFVMTMETKSGAITKMKTFPFPSINKSVDYRDYRMAVCQGIKPLKNGKFVAFFELISSAKSGSPSSAFSTSGGYYFDNAGLATITWEIDGFTSVVFSSDLSEANTSTFIWDEDSSDYGIKDYDIFSLVPRKQMPHDFCTLDEAGCYVENFVCDGTNWAFEVHSDDTKMSDYLIRCNENEMKSLKLLPPGLSLLTEPNKGLQVKDMGETVKLKIFSIN